MIAPETAAHLIQQMPVGVCVWDSERATCPEDLKLSYANPWALAHLFTGLKDPTNQTATEIAKQYGREPNKEFVKGAFVAATTQMPATIEVLTYAGKMFRVHYLPTGALVTASIFEDITDINEMTRKHLYAMESAHAGIWDFDYVHNRQTVDPGAASLMGLAPGEEAHARHDSFLSCISPKDMEDVNHLLTQALGTPGLGKLELEFRVPKAGQVLTLIDRVSITWDGPKAAQATHVLIDITDKAHLTAQLQQSNSDLKNFAHIASHDLREPLRVVINYVTLLFEEHGDKLTDPAAQQYREFIETSASRAMLLVDDLLRFSRAGNNIKPQPVQFSRLVQIATENLKIAIEEAGAEVLFDELPQVVCDAAMMVQVLQNLISNAVKFSAGGGMKPVVKVDVADKTDFWLVSVRDNGVGIQPEYLQKVFTPFYRLYSVAEYAGTGIGLALCQKIVRAHDGEIWAESEGQGRGTTLHFTLPKPA